MFKHVTALIAACCILGTGAAGAEELREMEGGSVAMGAVMGSVYYTEDGSDYRVVATLSAGPESTPVRVIARLRPGQNVTLSVPGLAGTPEEAISLIRTDNHLVISNANAHSVATN